jgi:DNA topoisomerase-1
MTSRAVLQRAPKPRHLLVLRPQGERRPKKNQQKFGNGKDKCETRMLFIALHVHHVQRWEETPHPDGVRWLTLEHKGPYFAPLYEVLPDHVHFKYNGKAKELSPDAEEVGNLNAEC